MPTKNIRHLAENAKNYARFRSKINKQNILWDLRK